MKRTFGWLGLTTAAVLICLEGASVAADNRPSRSNDSVPTLELLAQRRLPRRPLENEGVIRVPIRDRVSGIPVIAVTLNGNRTFPILVDTGATFTTITPEMARAARFKQEDIVKIRVGSGDVIDMPRGRVSSLRVGKAELNNFTVVVGSTPLLGQNFFGDYNVTIGENFVVFRPRRR